MQTEKNSGERWDKMRQDLMHRSQHVTMLSQCCHNAVVWTIVNSAKSPRFSKILQEIMKTMKTYENHPWMPLWIALGILRHARLFGSLQSHLSNRNSPWLRSSKIVQSQTDKSFRLCPVQCFKIRQVRDVKWRKLQRKLQRKHRHVQNRSNICQVPLPRRVTSFGHQVPTRNIAAPTRCGIEVLPLFLWLFLLC